MIMFKRIIQLSFFSVFFQCSLAWSQTVGTGVVDEIHRDEGWIVIDNNEYDFQANQLRIVYQGENVRLVNVQTGIRVRYRTNGRGLITQLTLVGPADRLREINNH